MSNSGIVDDTEFTGSALLIRLRDALREALQGWHRDIDPAWRGTVNDVRLGFDDVCHKLEIEPWEPIFPSRRDRHLPGEPEGAHILRAFDGLPPERVRCVLLGQDPYPCISFSTGRAFEAGNTAEWRELDKMFSQSVRAFLLRIAAARTGRPELGSDFDRWPTVLAGIEDGSIALEPPSELADRWAGSGVLLLNSSLTLSRFRIDVDPHQSLGHLPLWRPLILAVLRRLSERSAPLVVIALGDSASDNARRAGMGKESGSLVIDLPHPAFAEEFLARENPFLACNAHLERMGGEPVDW